MKSQPIFSQQRYAGMKSMTNERTRTPISAFVNSFSIDLYRKKQEIPAYRLKHGKSSNEHILELVRCLKISSKYTGTHRHRVTILSKRQARTHVLRRYAFSLRSTLMFLYFFSSVSLPNRHLLCFMRKKQHIM